MSRIQSQATFLQIADTIREQIIDGTYIEDERIPSVRELAEEMQVNPNTVARAYERLQMSEVIYPKRGMGYYVSQGAAKLVLKERKELFFNETLRLVKQEMSLLEISEDELLEQLRKLS